MNKLLKIKLEDLVIKTLKSIRKYPNILQRLKFYEQVHSNLVNDNVKNKREIYYNSVSIFKSQNVVDRLIKETCIKLGCTQSDLLISTTLKGIFNGTLIFHYKEINSNIVIEGTSLIPDMTHIDSLYCKYKKCLVIEKDTIFSKIIRDYKSQDILFVCGKGYPCRNTISLIDKLTDCDIYGIFDFDPYGLEICSKYPNTKLIRFDIELIDREYYLELQENDLKKINTLLKKGLFKEECEFMTKNNIKVELEGLFNTKGFNIVEYINKILSLYYIIYYLYFIIISFILYHLYCIIYILSFIFYHLYFIIYIVSFVKTCFIFSFC